MGIEFQLFFGCLFVLVVGMRKTLRIENLIKLNKTRCHQNEFFCIFSNALGMTMSVGRSVNWMIGPPFWFRIFQQLLDGLL